MTLGPILDLKWWFSNEKPLKSIEIPYCSLHRKTIEIQPIWDQIETPNIRVQDLETQGRYEKSELQYSQTIP